MFHLLQRRSWSPRAVGWDGSGKLSTYILRSTVTNGCRSPISTEVAIKRDVTTTTEVRTAAARVLLQEALHIWRGGAALPKGDLRGDHRSSGRHGDPRDSPPTQRLANSSHH